MGKGVMIAIAVGVVAALGVAAVFVMNRSSSNAPSSTSNTSNTATNSADSPQSLRALMDYAENQQCNFVDNESASTGEVYVGAGKMRGDFETTTDSNVMSSHVISDGQNLYLWTDDSAEGFKASLDDIEKVSESFGGSAQEAFDIDKDVDFSCSPWAVDNSKFSVPTDVEFQDFGAMMQGLGEIMEDKTLQCEACDNLPSDASAQCKQALGC